MDYDAIAAHFLVPHADPPPPPTTSGSPARRLRDAVEPIATIGWWSREASGSVNALGHDFFDGYVWGRAASLGAEVAPAVVAAAFGVFDPAMIGAVFTDGRSISGHDDVLEARATGAAAGLTAATSTVDESDVARFGDLLLAAVGDLDGSARPLFAALRDLAVPAGPYGRAWRAAELVREHRGDGHNAAFVAAGLDMGEINVLTEVWLGYAIGEYSSSRALSPERMAAATHSLAARGWLDAAGGLTAGGRVAREAIEAATDVSQTALIAALGDDLDDVVALGTTISAAILAAQAAPADPRKRAAG